MQTLTPSLSRSTGRGCKKKKRKKMQSKQQIPVKRPRRHDIFGVRVSATCYDEVVAWCIDRARQGKAGMVDLMAVHSLVTATQTPDYLAKINRFDIVAPDGQPV